MDLSTLTNDILPACQQLGVYNHICLIDHNAFALAEAETSYVWTLKHTQSDRIQKFAKLSKTLNMQS